jgi:hypothetical protein
MPAACSDGHLLGRYDAGDVRERLAAAGVLRALAEKGFDAVGVAIETAGHAFPCVSISACRDDRRLLLLEAYIAEVAVRAEVLEGDGRIGDRPFELVLVYWMREQNPIRPFSAERPPLPLQRHPGLGVLRRVFHVLVRMALELGKDGVASVPKFFHDAVLFFRARLFLFLDGAEQGRFEALVRDLAALPLGDASLALAGGCVRDRSGVAVSWSPGHLVFPVSERATAHFHSPRYAAKVAVAREQCAFMYDADLLARARKELAKQR